MWGYVPVLAVFLTIAACGSSAASRPTLSPTESSALANVVPCARWLAEPVVQAWVDNGCVNGTNVEIVATSQCGDGRVRYYTDSLAGVVGQPAVTVPAGSPVSFPRC